MNLASSLDRAEATLFADGLGERVVAADATTGELLQILRLRADLTAVPSFEFALRERTARLVNFRHAYYARVRRIDRVQATGSLAIVSDHVEGTRLSEMLRVAHARGLQLDTNAGLCLIRQLVPAVALLHENARDASHGLIAPERIIVTPHARLVIVEHVAGSAIEQLQFGRERLWQEFSVALPSSAGASRFDHRADVNGIGITALSLVLGRPLGAHEFPHAIPSLLMQARERSVYGEERPLSNAFRNWLARTLQLDVRRAFASAPEALGALEEILAGDSSYVAAPVALETFLSQYMAAMLEPPPAPAYPAPVVMPAPVLPGPGAFDPSDFADEAVADRSAEPEAPAIEPSRSAPTVVEIQNRTLVTDASAIAAAAPVSRSLESLPTLADLIQVSDLRLVSNRAPDVVPQPPGPPEPPAQSSVAEGRTDATAIEEASMEPEPGLAPPSDALLAQPDDDIRAAFAQDEEALEHDPFGPPRRPWKARLVAVAAAVVVIATAGVAGSRYYGAAGTSAPQGTLIVQSSPAGVEVFVDGVAKGATPARIPLDAGSHILELRGRGVPRVIPFQLAAGAQVSQYLEFADTPMTGLLVVHSEPAGANVTVDGVRRGVAPLTLEGMAPGDHAVLLENETGSSRHVVKVLAGTTASLVAPVTAAASEGPVSGWVSIKSPIMIEIREGGRLLGTTESERLMLAAGRHTLELVNETLGYRESQVVTVAPGKVNTVAIELPKGTVNLNATPWAEVWMDGKRLGETPLGNLEVPVGPHEFVFKHPEFGERRHAVSVTSAAPVRLSVPMK